MRVCLVVDLVFGLPEETNGLLALVHQVLHEDLKVFVFVQKLDVGLVVPEYLP